MSATLIIAAGAGMVMGFALGLALCWTEGRRLRKRNRKLRAIIKGEAKPRKRETMKVIVWACVLNGFAWIWCSYYLAYTDHQQIAETLSTAAVTEIIGAVLAYALKSLVENLSKNNHWPDKRPADAQVEPDANITDNGDAAG